MTHNTTLFLDSFYFTLQFIHTMTHFILMNLNMSLNSPCRHQYDKIFTTFLIIYHSDWKHCSFGKYTTEAALLIFRVNIFMHPLIEKANGLNSDVNLSRLTAPTRCYGTHFIELHWKFTASNINWHTPWWKILPYTVSRYILVMH